MLSPEKSADALLERSIAEKIFECGVLCIVKSSGETHFHACGLPKGMEAESALFDLASISKVVSTTSVAMLMADDGTLELDTPIHRSLPDFLDCVEGQMEWRSAVTPRMLLAHCSGFQAGLPFWKNNISSIEDRKKLVLTTSLAAKPGTATVYSDIGMIVMAQFLERLAGLPLDVLAGKKVFSPLGMTSTCYNPQEACRCIETEERPDAIGTYWKGVVHDENARWLGGVAGHAGVFSSAGDLSRFCRMLLDGGRGFVSEEVFRTFTAKAGLVPGSSRCLGWDGWSDGCAGGEYASPESFGHTGFTGTSIWIDRPKGIAVILLTNAVKPRRECKANGYFRRRNEIHALCYA